MIPRRASRIALVAAAALLLGTLAFLVAKTQSTGYNDLSGTLALMHELKDVGAGWDNDARRLANDFSGDRQALPDRAGVVARILQELVREPARAALGERGAALRAGIEGKQAAFAALRQAHERSRQALESANADLEVLAMAASARPASAATSALLLHLERLRHELASGDVEEHEAFERGLHARIATLVPAAAAVDPLLAGSAREALPGVAAFLAARAAESEAWRNFAFLPVGARVDLTARELNTAIEAALVEADRWRVYLIAYAAALLLGVGYLALRVLRAQAQLRAANLQLESRVAERTRELTLALERLKESEAQLVQTEKMSSLGQLVAGVAHEINTPLAYVKNSVAAVRDRLPELGDALGQSERLLGMLETEHPSAEELQAAFAALQLRLRQLGEREVLTDLDALTRDGLHGIEQIAELVANLRSFSRLDRSKVASFNLNDSVAGALLIARPMLRNIEVERRPAEIPTITCVPSQVNQVLLNLITNAVQAIDKPQGRIVIATRQAGDAGVCVEVTDNGKGIPPEVLPRIFDPFFTTKDPGSGTGLGLSIAYKIVADHGGRIEARSRPDEGTTFTVTLPIRPPAPVSLPLAQEAA